MGIVLAGSIVISIGLGGNGEIFGIDKIPTYLTHILGFGFFSASLILIYSYLAKGN